MLWLKRFLISAFLGMTMVALPALAAHDLNPNDGICPGSWWPQYSVSCETGRVACGTISGVPQCVAALPAAPSGAERINCDTCSWVCPANAPIVCGGACSPRLSCPAVQNRVTANECTGACGGCVTGFADLTPAMTDDACVAAAYLNAENPGELRVADALRITGTGAGVGDLYLNSGKAIRVEGAGAVLLNIGNWGGGATGAVNDALVPAVSIAIPNQPVSLNVFGELTVHTAAQGAGGTLRAPRICMGGDCRTAWPVPGGGGLGGGGTAGQVAFFTGPSALASNANLVWDAAANSLTTNSLSVGNGLTVGGNLTLSSAGATVDEVNLDNVLTGLTVAGGGLTISGAGHSRELALLPTCQNGQVLQWNAGTSTWGCATIQVPPGGIAEEADPIFVGWRDATVPGGQSLANLTVTQALTVGTISATTVNSTGCFGPTVVGATTVAVDGNLNSGDGYREIDALCSTEFPGSHQCETGEVMNSIHCGSIWTNAQKTALQAFMPQNTFVWIANGSPSLPTPTNDCYGWTQTGVVGGQQSQGIAWNFNVSGGGGYARACNLNTRILCCR